MFDIIRISERFQAHWDEVSTSQLPRLLEGRKVTLSFGDLKIRFIALHVEDPCTEIAAGRVIIEQKLENGKRHVYATKEVAKTLTPNDKIESIEEVSLEEIALLALSLLQLTSQRIPKIGEELEKTVEASRPRAITQILHHYVAKTTQLLIKATESVSKVIIKVARAIKEASVEPEAQHRLKERERIKDELSSQKRRDDIKKETLKREILKEEIGKQELKISLRRRELVKINT